MCVGLLVLKAGFPRFMMTEDSDESDAKESAVVKCGRCCGVLPDIGVCSETS